MNWLQRKKTTQSVSVKYHKVRQTQTLKSGNFCYHWRLSDKSDNKCLVWKPSTCLGLSLTQYRTALHLNTQRTNLCYTLLVFFFWWKPTAELVLELEAPQFIFISHLSSQSVLHLSSCTDSPPCSAVLLEQRAADKSVAISRWAAFSQLQILALRRVLWEKEMRELWQQNGESAEREMQWVPAPKCDTTICT